MTGIWFVTMARLREPAFLIVFFVGCIISYLFSQVGSFEVTNARSAEIIEATADPALQNVLLGTVLLTVLGMLITVFIAASEVPRDISSRMIAIYLSKPVSRAGYLFGKFIGSLSIGLTFAAIWITIMVVRRYFFSEIEDPLTTRVLVNQYFCLLMLVPTCAVSVAISCYFSDVLAMILTCIYVLLSFFVAGIPYIIKVLADDLLVKVALLPPYYLLPNLSYFVRTQQSPMEYISLLVYTVSITGIFLMIGRAGFNRGDIFGRN